MIFRRGGGGRPAPVTEDAPDAVVAAESEPERETGTRPKGPVRKRMALFDRVKYLLMLTVLWFVLVWAAMADNPLLPFGDAARERHAASAWLYAIAVVELVRQTHYLVSERWSGYHRFWTERFFGGFERQSQRRLSPWTRFRVGRILTWLCWIAIIAVVIGAARDTSPVLALFEVPALLWNAMPMVLQIVFIMLIAVGQFVAIFWFLSRGGVEVYYPDDIKTRFTDVWGQDHVLERVRENILYLEDPDRIEERGGYVPGGILLWGPPGTGKTLMAEAVAGETGRPYVFVDPGAFINMFFGIGVLKVKGLFRKLRKLALRYGGVIVFFDEADSLGRRSLPSGGGPLGQPGFGAASGCHGGHYLSEHTRQVLVTGGAAARGGIEDKVVAGMGMGGGGGGDMGTLQALLTEMSGLKKPRGFVNRHVRRALGMRPKPPPKYRILIMMATNLPTALDEALLRPGRIDRIYKVGYPSKAGRLRTYKGYFAKVAHELTDEQLDKLAVVTPYATGATIKDLVNESLIAAIREGREVITWADVMRAKRLKQLGPPEDVEYIERERHAVAVHEACHAVMAYRTRRHLEIDVATIEKGSDYLGMVASIKPEDQFTRWRSEYEADILVSLASLAGERMFFGEDNSSGVSGDLESATTVAALMEAYWGMGAGVSSLTALQALGIGPGTPDAKGGPVGVAVAVPKQGGGDAPSGRLGERIEKMLADLLAKAEEILAESRLEVLAVAHALEAHKTLTGDDVIAVIDGRQGPLVDGTVYTRPEFQRSLEHYHQAAVTAHEGHTGVTLTLPVPGLRTTGTG
ncbi:ATP-dependent Zn protease [Actinocorallia herbida]|uniref:ATP-dependent Zn protease n=1 Tax=Actinocorallia herbida TaxID=58109 RepID=A0A3N1CRB9_9ACTN|nr:AAA family ATPase [Actinocorallia herbida]ROO83853.1 ATP-dependent Zn protease [Actinocorallia herbida]